MVALAVLGISVASTSVAMAGSANKAQVKKCKKGKKGKKGKKCRSPKGAQGPAGPAGATGPAGTPGTPGTTGAPGADLTHTSSNWGVIARNTIGSPVAFYRDGPFGAFGVAQAPPYGTGSLGLSVADGTEKIAFGNEVDFFGQTIGGINQIGFSVFQTDENTDVPTNEASPGNLPYISFEVNPNLGGVGAGETYSSLNYNPNPVVNDNRWNTVDATVANTGPSAGWYFTNDDAETATGCTQNAPCTFAALKTALALDDAGPNPTPTTILSFGISKGRDFTWNGAVDGLRINNQVFDFEATGTRTVAP